MNKIETGLDQLLHMIETKAGPAMARTLGFRLAAAGDGWAEFEGAPSKDHYNPLGTTHGGWAATVLDSALGCAVHSKLKAGQMYGTVELKVNYVRAMNSKTGQIRCRGEIVHIGRRLATSEAKLFGQDGKLYAHGSCTCMIYE